MNVVYPITFHGSREKHVSDMLHLVLESGIEEKPPQKTQMCIRSLSRLEIEDQEAPGQIRTFKGFEFHYVNKCSAHIESSSADTNEICTKLKRFIFFSKELFHKTTPT